MSNLLLSTIKLAVKYYETGDMIQSELTLDHALSAHERFVEEVNSQEHLTLSQAALLACVCYCALTGQYIQLGIAASKNQDRLAEFFHYQNAGRCIDKAHDIFSYCQSPQMDMEQNVFIYLSLFGGVIAATRDQAKDAERYLKQCVEARATHPLAENVQSVAKNCLTSLTDLEANDVSEQVIKKFKEYFR
ncbi:MAG: hypothetical protein HBSAPP04_26210 [Ignavibacteriaceae bacterium]|nr:MAG: hypothetical protein HBSAPP04_26210 [Ignavibacteriaceae bacterium]